MNSLTRFSWQRLFRLISIEVENYWKKILLVTGMLYAFGLMIYTNASSVAGGDFSDGVFIFITLLVSATFTSIIYNDLHHPLERFQFLTLPCSQLERFLSKYLFTGPIILFFTIININLFKLIAPVMVRLFNFQTAPFIPFEEMPAQFLLMLFFTVHILFLIGSIVFKNFSVVKTGFFLFVLPYTFFLVSILSIKIIYFDHFDSFWSMESAENILPGIHIQFIRSKLFMSTAWSLIYLWLLFVGYTCLRDHEV